MSFSRIHPIKKKNGIFGMWHYDCTEKEASHFRIEVGFDGNEGELILPSRSSAEACFKAFVVPYERGEI